jgi:hypothetical protein
LPIEDIENRAASVAETVMSGTPEDETTEQVDETTNASRARIQAQRYLDVDDPEVAIIYIRRGAEALAKDSNKKENRRER